MVSKKKLENCSIGDFISLDNGTNGFVIFKEKGEEIRIITNGIVRTKLVQYIKSIKYGWTLNSVSDNGLHFYVTKNNRR